MDLEYPLPRDLIVALRWDRFVEETIYMYTQKLYSDTNVGQLWDSNAIGCAPHSAYPSVANLLLKADARMDRLGTWWARWTKGSPEWVVPAYLKG